MPGRFWDFCCGWGCISFTAFVNTFTVTRHRLERRCRLRSEIFDGSKGERASGGPTQLMLAQDGSYYTQTSIASDNEQLNAAAMSFTVSAPASGLSSLTLKLVEEMDRRGLRISCMRLFNYATNSFDLPRDNPQHGARYPVLSVPISNYANVYINSTRQVKMVPTRMVWPNPNRVDIPEWKARSSSI